MLGDNGFPHSIIITRESSSDTAPYTSLPSVDIWSGECSCQTGVNSETQFVSKSSYVVFTRLLEVEVKEGDVATIVKNDGENPIIATVQNVESVYVYDDEDVKYGTTLWVQEIKN